MVTYIWVNIASGNGLLSDAIKPLPEPVLTYHQGYSAVFGKISAIDMTLKNSDLKLQLHLPDESIFILIGELFFGKHELLNSLGTNIFYKDGFPLLLQAGTDTGM